MKQAASAMIEGWAECTWSQRWCWRRRGRRRQFRVRSARQLGARPWLIAAWAARGWSLSVVFFQPELSKTERSMQSTMPHLKWHGGCNPNRLRESGTSPCCPQQTATACRSQQTAKVCRPLQTAAACRPQQTHTMRCDRCISRQSRRSISDPVLQDILLYAPQPDACVCDSSAVQSSRGRSCRAQVVVLRADREHEEVVRAPISPRGPRRALSISCVHHRVSLSLGACGGLQQTRLRRHPRPRPGASSNGCAPGRHSIYIYCPLLQTPRGARCRALLKLLLLFTGMGLSLCEFLNKTASACD